MYSVGSDERLLEIEKIPACDIGAPLPSVVATEHYTALCYIAKQPPPEGWHGQYTNLVSHDSPDSPVILVEFRICADTRFGWFPDENTCGNHPLSPKGLQPYSAYEVANSSWVKELARLEAGNRDRSLLSMHHYVLTFHDTTFECVADSFAVRTHMGSVQDALANIVASLDE
ncbi:MAG: hypothetical protein AAGD11_09770 [Planctomycetota bacterium]